MTDTITMTDFIQRCGPDAELLVVDVREAAEYVEGHVPGAVLAPMSSLTTHLAGLPRDRDVYVICRSGNRSRACADIMAGQGIRAISVSGGTEAWKIMRQPVVEGREPGVRA